MSPQPTRITVLIANHNYAKFIDEAVESVRKAQLAAGEPLDVKVLIGDDKSTDNSVQVIKELAGRSNAPGFGVSFSEFPTNRGPNAVLNDLVRQTPKDSDYTVVLDADDRLRPQFFKTMLHAMRKAEAKDPKVDFAYSNCMLVDPVGVPFNKGISRPFNADAYQEISYIPSTSLMKSSVLREAVEKKPFDETVRKHTKHTRYKQLINDGGSKGLYVPAALFDYRQHESNLCEIGKATLTVRDGNSEKQHRITQGGYYGEGEQRMTFRQYMDSLNAQFGISQQELEANAGGELEYAEKTGVFAHSGRRVERSRDGVNLSAHWGVAGAVRA